MSEQARPPVERPPEDLKARLLAAAAREPATRPGNWRRRVAAAAVAGASWLAIALFAKGLRHDWSDLPVAAWALTIIVLTVSAAAATSVVFRRGPAMVGAGMGALSVAVWGVPVALVVLVSAVDPCGASTVQTTSGGVLGRAAGCLGLTVTLGLPLIGLGLMVLRGLTLSRPAVVGASLGLGAATWAHVVVRMHCPVGGFDHALLGHVLSVLLLMALGAWATWALDRRALAPRRKP